MAKSLELPPDKQGWSQVRHIHPDLLLVTFVCIVITYWFTKDHRMFLGHTLLNKLVLSTPFASLHRNKALQKNEPAHGQSLDPPPLWSLPCSTSKEAREEQAGERQSCCPSVEATEATLSHRRDPDGGKKAVTTGGRKDTPVLVTLSTMPFQPMTDILYDVDEYCLEKQDI